MKETKTASRYAKSLLDLALDKNSLDKMNADMKLVEEVCEQNPEFIYLLDSPIVKSDKKIAIFNAILKGKVTEDTLIFLALLAKKRRESFLPGIASEFSKLYNTHKGIQKAIVTTANGIDDELRKKVFEVIKKSTSSEIELVEKTNKDLIGGFILKIGDTQIDSSIVRSIKKLKQNFSENPYIPEI
jgi:F-type H+-transporting ATPase subunit delta